MRPLLGVDVAVQINGVDAREYDAPNPDGESAPHVTVTKYIECVDDALFGLRVDVGHDYDWEYRDNTSIRCELLIDGQSMDRSVLRWAGQRIIEGSRFYDAMTQQWKLQQFRFSSVKLGRLGEAAFCHPRYMEHICLPRAKWMTSETSRSRSTPNTPMTSVLLKFN
jgi:hypothetical protein